MPNVNDERSLIIAYRDAKLECEQIAEKLEQATQIRDRCERDLIEYLDSKDANATARYEGVGYVGLVKPRLYASYTKDNEDKVFSFLKDHGREDLVRPTVNKQSLSSFVSEACEQGMEIPEYISYYLKPSARIYAD